MHTKKNLESINTTLRNFLPGIASSVEAGETPLLMLAELLQPVLSAKLPILEKLEAVKENIVLEEAVAAAATLLRCANVSGSRPHL